MQACLEKKMMRGGRWGHCWVQWEGLLVRRQLVVRSAVETLECPIHLGREN